jgi:heme exporter protein B
MNFWTQTLHLFNKELRLEWRRRYALSGVLLYVLSTVFVVYIIVGEKIGGVVWASLFWIIVLFASVNAVAKSFVQENPQRQLYYYTLASPAAVILSKMLYNTVLLTFISALSYGAFSLIMDSPIKEVGLFWLILVMGSMAFAITFTFVAAISSKAQQSATLMAILSFPIIIPILMTLTRLTKISLGLMTDTDYYKDIFILLGIDLILGALVFVLFPYLWRD